MLVAARRAMHTARWIEWRLDYLKSASERERLLHAAQRLRPRGCEFIFTMRRTVSGGKFKGSEICQLDWLKRFAELKQWLDIEIETLQTLAVKHIRDLGCSSSKIIVSYHNFRSTPTDLASLAQKLDSTGADLIKIAAQANSLSDAARLIDAQRMLRRQRRCSVVLGMGTCGVPTRVLGPSCGAQFTYATLEPGKESAPGQLTVQELKSLYRIDRINSRTRIFGILGHPVGHSLSPRLYNGAFARLGLNSIHLPFDSPHLDGFLESAKKLKLSGLSITLPHKNDVMQFLSEIDPPAKKIGAVNTLRLTKGRWKGYNTDVIGIAQPLEEAGVRLNGAEVLLLGAGGAAQAAAAALAEAGALAFIFNRTEATARTLARRFGHRVIRFDEIQGKHFDLLINATPIGMWPSTHATPIDLSDLRVDVVFDLVYNPAETQLLKTARRLCVRTISGVRMFVAQARTQFRILTGRSLPESVVRQIQGVSPQ
jgi:3-dehydroquinate dehydratase/shikimate dehydrogenase